MTASGRIMKREKMLRSETEPEEQTPDKQVKTDEGINSGSGLTTLVFGLSFNLH